MAKILPTVAGLLLALVGCTSLDKAEVEEDFSDLSALDSKSDAFSYRLKLHGTLTSGDSKRTLYKSVPRFRGYEFFASAGDTAEVWVRSSRGDALAWLLDGKFNVIVKNDDASDATLDAFMRVVLPESRVPEGRYYIVYRDYHVESRYFTTSLQIEPGTDPDLGDDWQTRAKDLAETFVLDVAALAPYEIAAAQLPAIGQTRVLASSRAMAVVKAFRLLVDDRTCYLIYGTDNVVGGVTVMDLVDDSGLWFAHGLGEGAGEAMDFEWRFRESDQTLCNCDNPSNGMATCTWIDGSVHESTISICD